MKRRFSPTTLSLLPAAPLELLRAERLAGEGVALHVELVGEGHVVRPLRRLTRRGVVGGALGKTKINPTQGDIIRPHVGLCEPRYSEQPGMLSHLHVEAEALR